MNNLAFDSAKTALVVIDLQKGIVGFPTVPHASALVVKNAAALAAAARTRGLPVFLVHVTPSPDGKDALQPVADAPRRMPALPPDWAEIVPELGPQPGDFVITKRQWGAFYGTDLDLQCRRRGLTTMILCGIATNIGVESTARFAFEYGYQQLFAEDAMAAMSADEHAYPVTKIFPRLGRVRSTAEIVAALTPG